MQKILIAATLFCICSCGKVKTEPVRVIQTDSVSNAFVIKVDRAGKHYIYIPNESNKLEFAKLTNLKAASGDSIWKINLSEIDNAIATYKEATKGKYLNIKIEADRNTEYQNIKSLLKCLQDAGYTRYNLTTKP